MKRKRPWRICLGAAGAVLALSAAGCNQDPYAPDPQAQAGTYDGGAPAALDKTADTAGEASGEQIGTVEAGIVITVG